MMSTYPNSCDGPAGMENEMDLNQGFSSRSVARVVKEGIIAESLTRTPEPRLTSASCCEL